MTTTRDKIAQIILHHIRIGIGNRICGEYKAADAIIAAMPASVSIGRIGINHNPSSDFITRPPPPGAYNPKKANKRV